jgi:hypothetical protein
MTGTAQGHPETEYGPELLRIWQKISALGALLGVDDPVGRSMSQVLDDITARVRLLKPAEEEASQGAMSVSAWQTRVRMDRVQAIRLTEDNAQLVVTWLAQNGVNASWNGPPMRLSFGGARGSYCMQDGDWIVLYADGRRPGAEGWLDEYWQETWERAD